MILAPVFIYAHKPGPSRSIRVQGTGIRGIPDRAHPSIPEHPGATGIMILSGYRLSYFACIGFVPVCLCSCPPVVCYALTGKNRRIYRIVLNNSQFVLFSVLYMDKKKSNHPVVAPVVCRCGLPVTELNPEQVVLFYIDPHEFVFGSCDGHILEVHFLFELPILLAFPRHR